MFTISVDLDSTLNNLDEVWLLDRYNKLYNDNLTKEDLVRWEAHTYVKPECGYKVYEILEEPGLFAKLGVRDDYTVDVFEYLYNHHDVYIVSSCQQVNTIADKISWIKKHLPFFDTNRFIACHHKYLINTDYLIDDGPHNIETFKQKGILIDAPYNRYLTEGNFIRVKDWSDIYKYFRNKL